MRNDNGDGKVESGGTVYMHKLRNGQSRSIAFSMKLIREKRSRQISLVFTSIAAHSPATLRRLKFTSD